MLTAEEKRKIFAETRSANYRASLRLEGLLAFEHSLDAPAHVGPGPEEELREKAQEAVDVPNRITPRDEAIRRVCSALNSKNNK